MSDGTRDAATLDVELSRLAEREREDPEELARGGALNGQQRGVAVAVVLALVLAVALWR